MTTTADRRALEGYASAEHLRAEHDRLDRLETSLRAHLSRTIIRAERAERQVAAVRDVCDVALAVKLDGSTENDVALAAAASVILRALDQEPTS